MAEKRKNGHFAIAGSWLTVGRRFGQMAFRSPVCGAAPNADHPLSGIRAPWNAQQTMSAANGSQIPGMSHTAPPSPVTTSLDFS